MPSESPDLPELLQSRGIRITPARLQVLGELARLGDRVHVPEPSGAFYALMRVQTRRTDMELIESLIKDFGVAVMPGSTFGILREAGCYLRIAYGALAADTVADGMSRLVRGLTALV